jgi:hypothetical protein
MRARVLRIAMVLGIVMAVAACDKCGNLDITGVTTPKTCSGAKPT